MVTPWSNWCRLCSKDNGCEVELLPNKINGDDKIAWRLQKLMAKHFSVLISDDGQTPTGICRKCHQFIENLQMFSDRVSKVETMFSELIQKQVCLLEDEVDNIRQQYGIAKVKDFDKCDQSTDTNDLMIEYLPVDGDDECSNNMAEVKSEPYDEEVNEEMKNLKHNDAFSTNLKTENADEDEKYVFEGKQQNSRMNTRKRKLRTKEIEYDNENEKVANENEEYAQEYDSGNDDEYVMDKKRSKKDKKMKLNREKKTKQMKVSVDKNSITKEFKCESCEMVFSRKNSLKNHMANAHEEETKFECTICNKNFPSEKRLKQHSNTHLLPEQKMVHPCPYCGKKFTNVESVDPHIRAIHMGDKPFICEKCGKTFVTKGSLKEHSFSHSDEFSYTCSKCPKRFKNTSNLRRHEDIHSNTVYDCPHCGLKLKTRRSLRAHLVVHSDERKYKCQYCDSAFKRPRTLKTHLLVHTGLKPSRCPFCERAFSNNKNCKNHQRAEHPEEFAALYINQVSNVPISCNEENT